MSLVQIRLTCQTGYKIRTASADLDDDDLDDDAEEDEIVSRSSNLILMYLAGLTDILKEQTDELDSA